MAARKLTAGRILEVLSSGSRALAGRDERVLVRVHVDATCPRGLARCVRDALVPERGTGDVEVLPLAAPPAGADAPDVALVLVGDGPCAELVGSYARAGVPVAMVVEGALDAPRLELPEQAAALVGTVAASSPEALLDKLAEWLAASCDKDLALAANFAFCRRAVSDALVARCALENAAVGAISLIPGSDLPVMCVNQAKLALELAAAHGLEARPERALDLVGVVGAGLVWRALARRLVSLVPGVGALLKAGVAYGGTLATGAAVRLHVSADAAPAPAAGPVASPAPSPATLPVPREDEGYVTIGGGAS